MEKKTYRCVSRTKRSFETALATLSKTTPLPKITVKALRDVTLVFRGSRNQRIIDVQASLSEGKIVTLEYSPAVP